MTVNYCPNCGEDLSQHPSAAYCPGCGSLLDPPEEDNTGMAEELISKDVEEMTEAEKDRLLEHMAEKYADKDEVVSRAFELAAQASPPKDGEIDD